MLTTAARSLASWPSGRSGWLRYSVSVTTRPSTESPRNSRRSLVGRPPFSYAYERWVSARSRMSASSRTEQHPLQLVSGDLDGHRLSTCAHVLPPRDVSHDGATASGRCPKTWWAPGGPSDPGVHHGRGRTATASRQTVTPTGANGTRRGVTPSVKRAIRRTARSPDGGCRCRRSGTRCAAASANGTAGSSPATTAVRLPLRATGAGVAPRHLSLRDGHVSSPDRCCSR